MKEPTRYSPFLNQHGGRYIPSMDCPDMKEDNDGDWVSLSDYKQLQAEVERLNELANDPYRLSKVWRPIETAPKDGTWVLLWWKETPTGAECFDEWCPEQAVGKWHYDCWMRCSEYSVGGTPTHWMPLPKPPTP